MARQWDGWDLTPLRTGKHVSAAEKGKYGMYDTRDLVKRSEKCVTCHVGTADKQVDHEMIAAGHPDLTFELDSFSAVMPRHWKINREENPWIGVQSWAIGQAVQLRESLNRLSRRASSSTLAGLRRAGLFCLPPCSDCGERQLAAHHL